MVEVTMGIESHDGLKATSLNHLLKYSILASIHITSVDDYTLLCIIPHKIGILAKGVENNTFNLHI
jgi:hypothetical protein